MTFVMARGLLPLRRPRQRMRPGDGVREPLPGGVAQGLELRQGGRVDAGGHGVLLGHLRGLVEAGVVVVAVDLQAEAVRAHAVHAEAEHGVLDGGVARDHERLHLALARVVRELLDDLVGRLARRAEHDAHAAHALGLARGELVAAAVEHDDGAPVAAGVVHHVVDEALARRVERVVGVVGPRDLAVAAPRPQHVVPVHDQQFFALLTHHRSKSVSEGGCGARDRGEGEGEAYFGTRVLGLAARSGNAAGRSVGPFRRSENGGT